MTGDSPSQGDRRHLPDRRANYLASLRETYPEEPLVDLERKFLLPLLTGLCASLYAVWLLRVLWP